MIQDQWAGVACMVAGLVAGANAPAFALSVDPPVVELRAAAGSRVNGAFRVTNDTTGPILITVETERLSPTGYVQRHPQEWLEVTPSRVSLAPGEATEVAYRVFVPEGIEGELAATVVLVQELGSQHEGVGVQVRFGMALYVSIAGTEQLDLRVEHMTLEPHDESPHAWIHLVNQGNIHCRPEGSIIVEDAQGQAIAQGRLLRSLPVHPGQPASFAVPCPGLRADPGTYHLRVDFTCFSVAQLPSHVSVVHSGTVDETGQWTPTDPPTAISSP